MEFFNQLNQFQISQARLPPDCHWAIGCYVACHNYDVMDHQLGMYILCCLTAHLPQSRYTQLGIITLRYVYIHIVMHACTLLFLSHSLSLSLFTSLLHTHAALVLCQITTEVEARTAFMPFLKCKPPKSPLPPLTNLQGPIHGLHACHMLYNYSEQEQLHSISIPFLEIT